MSWVDPREWRRTLFMDEKRFCLYGPDGLAHHWHEIRLERSIFSKRQRGVGG